MVGALQEALANGSAGVIPELRAACMTQFGDDWRSSVPGEWEANNNDEEEEEAGEAASPGKPTKEEMRAKQRERAPMHEVREEDETASGGYKIGTKVRVVGMPDSEHNGKTATVQLIPDDSGKPVVKMDEGGSMIKMKLENLEEVVKEKVSIFNLVPTLVTF